VRGAAAGLDHASCAYRSTRPGRSAPSPTIRRPRGLLSREES
jgi:hypothetical protein